MQRSDLPFGSEFSPTQIELKTVLELAKAHGGDWRAFEDSVRETYFEQKALIGTSDYNRRKLANNTKLSMIAYGLIDRDANLTSFGSQLYGLRNDETRMQKEFARHILLQLNGAALVQCIQDIQAAGEAVTLIKLREWLEERGIHFPRGGKHASTMRLWLARAGVFVQGWRVDEARLAELLGQSAHEIDALSRLSPEQRAYLKALANLGGVGPYLSNDVEKVASAAYGVRFNEKSLPKTVLYPLAEAGYVRLERGTDQGAHGAKPFRVYPTDKMVGEVIGPLLEQIDRQVDVQLRPLLRKPLGEILEELGSPDKHVRGLALEALAFKLMRLVDLAYVFTRLRGSQTGGAEVDLVFEGSRLVFSRWQIQCKNTSAVSLDDVAKEVGLTHLLKSNVVVMVTTGTIGPEARKYANTVMKESNLCIAMIDGADLRRVTDDPPAIVDVLNREAKQTMKLKALDRRDDSSSG